MSACCSGGCSVEKPPLDPRYRRILWIALVVNAAMFAVEMASGWRAGSVSLLADAVDFFGDAANYGLSLFVLGMAAVWRSRAALAKGVAMGVYGVVVLGAAGYNLTTGVVPEHATMGFVGTIALLANLLVAGLLFSFRNGDANMRSVWLCTRNDVIGNIAVLFAALGVFGTGAGWPDIIVAAIMAILGLTAAQTVIRQARAEMSAGKVKPVEPRGAVELKRR